MSTTIQQKRINHFKVNEKTVQKNCCDAWTGEDKLTNSELKAWNNYKKSSRNVLQNK